NQNLKSRITRTIGCYSFWCGFVHRSGRWDEAFDRSILGAADPNPLLKARVRFLVRLRIGHVDRVVRINENTARAAELFPFSQELTVLVKNLDTAVPAVTHEYPSLGINRDGM